MLVKVKYLCNNIIKDYLIDTNEKIAIVNGERKQFNIDDLEDKILDIIIFWPEEINFNNVTTEKIQCEVVVSKNNIKNVYKFNGALPENFYEIEELLKEIEHE